jgi:hypothetical protein
MAPSWWECLCAVCFPSKKPSEQEFFDPAGMDLAVKLLWPEKLSRANWFGTPESIPKETHFSLSFLLSVMGLATAVLIQMDLTYPSQNKILLMCPDLLASPKISQQMSPYLRPSVGSPKSYFDT